MPWAMEPPLPPSSRDAITEAGAGRVAAFVGEPIVGATLAAAVPPDDYWPAGRGCLLAPRRAVGRRRGHDRVRPDGTLVRPRSLGRPAGPARRGQGGHLRLLAVRLRRGGGARVRDRDRPGRRLRPRVHVLARAGRGGGRAGRSCASSTTRTWWAASATQGQPAARAPRRNDSVAHRAGRRDPRPRTDGRAGARGGPGHAPAVPARGARHRGSRLSRRGAWTAGLLRYRECERHRRRHDPARTTIHRHRRGAGADREMSSPKPSPRR